MERAGGSAVFVGAAILSVAGGFFLFAAGSAHAAGSAPGRFRSPDGSQL